MTAGVADGLVVRVDRLDPGQVQQRVEQRGGVPGREHEPVAVGPHRQLGVEPQEPRPQRVAHRRQRHRRARMPRVRRLHRVHRQRADGVDGQLVDRLGVEVDVRLGPHGHRSVLTDGVRFELPDSIQCTIVLGEIHYRRAGAGSCPPQHAFVTSVHVPVQSGGTSCTHNRDGQGPPCRCLHPVTAPRW